MLSLNLDEGCAKSAKQTPEEVDEWRINTMPAVNKPFSRLEYTKPRSMIVPSFQATYIKMRRQRPGFGSRLGRN